MIVPDELLQWLSKTAALPEAPPAPAAAEASAARRVLEALPVIGRRLTQLAGVVLILVVGIITYRAVSADAVIIEPVGVSPTLQRLGVTPETAARSIADRIALIARAAQTEIPKRQFTPAPSASGAASAPADLLSQIEIAKTKITIRSVVEQLRDLLGTNATRVSAELTGGDKNVGIVVRVQRRGETPAIVAEQSRKPGLDGCDPLFSLAGEHVLAHTDPYVLAAYRYRGGRKDTCIRLLAYCLRNKTDRDDAWARLLWGVLLEEKGRVAEAADMYKAVTLSRQRTAAALGHNSLGNLAYRLEIFPGAQREYDLAIREDPDLPFVHLNLALTLARLGAHDGAATHLRMAAHLAPDSPEVLLAWAYSLYKRGDLEGAKLKYFSALDLNEHLAPAYYGLGVIAEQQRALEQSRGLYKQAINADPTYTAAFLALARSYLATEDYGAAKPAATRGVHLAPKNGEAHRLLGVVLADSGHWESARFHLREAMKLGVPWKESEGLLAELDTRRAEPGEPDRTPSSHRAHQPRRRPKQ